MENRQQEPFLCFCASMQCMMKSSCDAPTTMPSRTVIQTGRKGSGANTDGYLLR